MHGIARTRRGEFRVRLLPRERELLRGLPDQLRELVASGDASIARLFPPAYADSDAAEEYDRLVRGELRRGKLAALRVLEETADAETLSSEQLNGWLGALESLRLVLGTQLDVTEETYADPPHATHPQAALFALYGWLSWLQEEVVEALGSTLETA
jgi:hypothetical protein